MKRKHLLVLIALVIALVTVLVACTFSIIDMGERMEFQTLEKGYHSGHTNPAYYVINDATEWANVWNQLTRIIDPQPPLPEINFSNTTIIAVFMGQFNTGGYGIEVKEIIDTGQSIVVRVEKIYPGKGCIVTEALSQPFHVVKLDKVYKQVVFDTITKTIECNSL